MAQMVDAGSQFPWREFREARAGMWRAGPLATLLILLLVVSAARSAHGQEANSADPALDRTITEELPATLQPRRARSEAEEDVLISAAHFAQARLHLQRGDDSLALRHFQRAWRFNADRVALLDEVVVLASKLGRNELAARYAVLSAERRPRDARMLIQLGALLAQQDDLERALWMYEKAIERQAEDKLTPQTVALRIEMGRLYFLNENFPQAARAFTEVRDALDDPQVISEEDRKKLVTKPHALYSLIAACFLEAERPEEAEAMYRVADSFDANPARLNYQLAEVALRQDDLQQARQRLDAYLDAKSTTGALEPYRLLKTLCQREHPDPAAAESAGRDELRRRHEDDPDNQPLAYFWAAELLAAGQLDAARELYRDLLKRQATADAYTALAGIYRQQEDIPDLLNIMEQVIARTESLELLEDEISKIVQQEALLTKLFDEAREKCREAPAEVRQATGLAAAHLAIAANQLETMDPFVEIAVEAAGDAKAKVRILQQLGLTVFIAEDADRAQKLFQRALAEQPDEQTESTLQYYLAGASQFAGDTETALAAATRAAELRSDSPRFASRKPWILYRAKRFDQAESLYLELIDANDSKYDDAAMRDVLREARMILSNIAVERKELARAEEWLAQVLDEFPEDIGAKNDLGYLWADQGKHLRRAMVMTQEAVEAEPENVAYRDSLGWAYYRLGRFEDAVRELTIATGGEDPDGVILDHLGDVHWSAKQPDQAVAAWQRAISAFRQAEQTDRAEATEAKIKQHRQD